ncbi:hypothetical protein P3T43_001380 [Paraburkholderia sp. GAS41]|jgi:hypothetical protein|uniref:DUF3331 domain-containing protein n=1 Tax=Paraburkholderia sp. GAS41 TaxID=3035134 RepID=UPI003D239F18
MTFPHSLLSDDKEFRRVPKRREPHCHAGGDAWTQVVSLLEKRCSRPSLEDDSLLQASAPARLDAAAGEENGAEPYMHGPNIKTTRASITVIEHLSQTAVTLRWSSGFCHYGDQVWSRQIARRAGICAATGMSIKRGDPAFRPRNRGRHAPANVDVMIHPSAIRMMSQDIS